VSACLAATCSNMSAVVLLSSLLKRSASRPSALSSPSASSNSKGLMSPAPASSKIFPIITGSDACESGSRYLISVVATLTRCSSSRSLKSFGVTDNLPTDGYATATRRPGLSAPAIHEVRFVDSLRGGNAEQISRRGLQVRRCRSRYEWQFHGQAIVSSRNSRDVSCSARVLALEQSSGREARAGSATLDVRWRNPSGGRPAKRSPRSPTFS
jgi:hypothetical protein